MLRRGHIAGGEDVRHARDPQIVVDGQPAEPVARHRELLGERVGAHPGAPHRSGGGDHLAGIQRHAFAVDGDDPGARPHLDADVGQRGFDHRPRGVTHIRPDAGIVVDQNDAWPHVRTERRPDPVREFARRLDPRQPRADDHRGRTGGRHGIDGQLSQVRIESHCGVIGVDVEAVLPQTRDGGLGDPAAGREHQAVVAVGPAVGGHRVRDRVDGRHRGGDMADTGGVEHRRQRDAAGAQIGLVVAHPDVVIGDRTQHGDRDLTCGNGKLVEAARRAQRRPQPGEPRSDHDHIAHPEPPSLTPADSA